MHPMDNSGYSPSPRNYSDRDDSSTTLFEGYSDSFSDHFQSFLGFPINVSFDGNDHELELELSDHDTMMIRSPRSFGDNLKSFDEIEPCIDKGRDELFNSSNQGVSGFDDDQNRQNTPFETNLIDKNKIRNEDQNPNQLIDRNQLILSNDNMNSISSNEHNEQDEDNNFINSVAFAECRLNIISYILHDLLGSKICVEIYDDSINQFIENYFNDCCDQFMEGYYPTFVDEIYLDITSTIIVCNRGYLQVTCGDNNIRNETSNPNNNNISGGGCDGRSNLENNNNGDDDRENNDNGDDNSSGNLNNNDNDDSGNNNYYNHNGTNTPNKMTNLITNENETDHKLMNNQDFSNINSDNFSDLGFSSISPSITDQSQSPLDLYSCHYNDSQSDSRTIIISVDNHLDTSLSNAVKILPHHEFFELARMKDAIISDQKRQNRPHIRKKKYTCSYCGQLLNKHVCPMKKQKRKNMATNNNLDKKVKLSEELDLDHLTMSNKPPLR